MTRAALAVIIAIAGTGCGAEGSGDDVGNPDANPNQDAPMFCQVDVFYDQSMPTAGVGVTIGAQVLVSGVTGPFDYGWDVRDPSGAALPLTPDATSDVVRFPIETNGDYQVRVTVTPSFGEFCPTYDNPLFVQAPGANSTVWRIRLVPDETIPAPPQEIVRSIPSSPSIDIGDIILDGGVAVNAEIHDGAANGIGAYVRVTSAANLTVEAYADATTGALAMYIPVGPVDALVIPADSTIPPIRVPNWAGQTIDVSNGNAISGTVYDPTGAPLGGARVSLVVDGVPSTVATTAPDGTYTLRARTGGITQVTVAPTDASGLPRLVATFAAGPSTPLDITYDMAITTRNLAGTVLQRGGTPMPGERITFVGSIGPAGSAAMGGTNATAAGDVLITAVAGAGGALPVTRAPTRPLTAVLIPTLMEAAVVPVDLTTAAPAAINAPAMAPLTARVVGPLGETIGGSRVIAIPVGPLAAATAAPAVGTTAGDGTVTLPVAPGGSYDVVVDDPHRLWARQWVTAVGAGALGDVIVQPAMRVIGTIKQPGGNTGARSSAVAFYCYDCTGIAAERPVGESGTSSTGGFALVVTDPGVSTVAAKTSHAPVTVAVPLGW